MKIFRSLRNTTIVNFETDLSKTYKKLIKINNID